MGCMQTLHTKGPDAWSGFSWVQGLMTALARVCCAMPGPGWVTGRAVSGLPDTHPPLVMAVDPRPL